MGRGVYRNYYKGHMDKIKGEGGGGGGRWVRLGWGENADNCNCITIKLKKNTLQSPPQLFLEVSGNASLLLNNSTSFHIASVMD